MGGSGLGFDRRCDGEAEWWVVPGVLMAIEGGGGMGALWLAGWGAFLRYGDWPGARPAIVWLHCLGGAAMGYVQVAGQPGLAGRRSLLVDLLGFGCSDRPEGFGYTLEEQAGTVAAL